MSRTPLIQPSFSGLFVTCAYFPHTTFPPCVTIPSSETFTSIIVPFVITPGNMTIYLCKIKNYPVKYTFDLKGFSLHQRLVGKMLSEAQDASRVPKSRSYFM